jgi:membrane protease YdiL (CAAX protease family)
MDAKNIPAGLVASKRHTIILSGILLTLAALGLLSNMKHSGGVAEHPASVGVPLYIGLALAEWGLFLYVRAGLRRRGASVRELISARPLTVRTLSVDLLLGFLVLGLFIGAEILLGRVLGSGNADNVKKMLIPHGVEIVFWILLSVTAGFVEEFVFRGYLQRQFTAWFDSRWLGVFAQALLFGISHGYQGGVQILKISLFGLLFGFAAMTRRSLLPGMIAHGVGDILAPLSFS